MSNVNNFYFHFFEPQYRIFAAFLAAGIINLYLIPVIIRISKAKKLFDIPDDRKTHGAHVPTLGGLGIFASIAIVSLVFINTCGIDGSRIGNALTSLPSIIAGLTLIFFIGMKDDILNVPAWKKLAIEFIALFIIIIIGNIQLDSMQGMFSIGHLRYYVSIPLSLFAGIVIINSFNLIDGIDGLASAIAMLASIVFGSYFLITQEWEFAILASVVLGALIPFFMYNVFGKSNKIFMGDTGSLILGFVMVVLVFRFNEMNANQRYTPLFMGGPAFSFAVLILPMFDTLRVFTIRIFRGTSPFKADRRHIHHILLDLGLTHLQATLVLIIINIAFIVFAYYFNYLGNSVLIYIMIPTAIVLSMLAIVLRRRKLSKKNL